MWNSSISSESEQSVSCCIKITDLGSESSLWEVLPVLGSFGCCNLTTEFLSLSELILWMDGASSRLFSYELGILNWIRVELFWSKRLLLLVETRFAFCASATFTNSYESSLTSVSEYSDPI